MSILKRETFLIRLGTGKVEDIKRLFYALPVGIIDIGMKRGIDNFSIWHVSGLVFGYYEVTRDYVLSKIDKKVLASFIESIAVYGDILGDPFNKPMRLMYSDIGIVRTNKSLIRHRVFATKLKEGCNDEYKRRHDELTASKGGVISEGPESNFTIWNAGQYIFGYCELVRSFDHEMTEEEKASTIAWETRGLEIMDWITDDVDWITGQKHDKIELVCKL
ncbi:MAG: L-rhamnose mutarotase [Clostridiales bacterium]|nr:L-rhamnose mutarotase [Clostridiales bacterium]